MTRRRAGSRAGETGRTRSSGEAGNASVEFVVLATLLLVPVIYLVVTLGRLQAAAFAADSAARAAVRAYTTAPDETTAADRAQLAVALGLQDQGFDPSVGATLQISCAAPPCLTRATQVSARVSLDVVLPGVPAALDAVLPTHVVVRATQSGVVDAFRAR